MSAAAGLGGLAFGVLSMGAGAALIWHDVRARRSAREHRLTLALPSRAARAWPAAEGGLDARPATAELRELTRLLKPLGIGPCAVAPVYRWSRAALAALAGAGAFIAALKLIPAPGVALALLPMLTAASAGWLLPGALVARAVHRRAASAADGLPDALELLVVCVEAGLSLEDGLARAVTELRHARPALAEELALTAADLAILPSRDQALANLALRLDVPSVRSLVTTLSQTLRYGTPLAQAMRTVATELRADALLRIEERANELPVMLTVPMMLFIMPTIFLIVGGPAALRIIDIFLR